MLFFGTRCERLCLTQFSLISLIPRLLHNLQDSAGPELDNYEKSLTTPTSLRTSDRNSLLSYMGLPLQIFGKVRPLNYYHHCQVAYSHPPRAASSGPTPPSSSSTSSPTSA